MLDNYIRVRLPASETEAEVTALPTFAASLKRYTSYSNWRELSSLSYGDPSTAYSIVSSIEFDKDGEVFAVAGVTKKIKDKGGGLLLFWQVLLYLFSAGLQLCEYFDECGFSQSLPITCHGV